MSTQYRVADCRSHRRCWRRVLEVARGAQVPDRRACACSRPRVLRGKTLAFHGREITIEELTEDSFNDIDIAFFSAGGSISKAYGPIAAKAGAVVVDNSSAFRMDPNVAAGDS